MGKMHEIACDGVQVPRFDDGTANMAELIRVMAESLVNEVMDAQADEACEAGRRWFNDDSIGRAVEGAKANAPAPGCEGTAAEHAARIISLVMAGNPVPGRKAAWHALE